MRTERDALGPLDLPDDCLYGIHTVRALVNFGTGPERHDREFVRAYLLVKKACALANAELGYLDRARAQALTAAIDSLIDQGRFDDVVVNPVSGGAGTS
ncbi:MAG TPA: lyase family protein, partial [Deltaproteobacteria bacterium]|nr:lyase family protein [Deltaproteobacteria bacterium]